MAIARVKTWVSEVLTSADLNAEFNNILTYLNSGTVVLTTLGIGATPTDGILHIRKDQDTFTRAFIYNASLGTSSSAMWSARGSSGNNLNMGVTSLNYTPTLMTRADGGFINFNGAGGLSIQTSAAQPLYFGINNVEKARIEETNGALLIGTTTMATGRKLVVSSSAAAVNVAAIYNTNATPGAAVQLNLNYTASTPDDNTALFMSCSDATTTRLIIYSDGDVINHDNSYGAISKREIKQDVVELPSHWDAVKAYPLRQYRMKEDVAKLGEAAPVRRGVVADELAAVAPHLVKNGEYVVYSHMYLEAVAALQEAMARIEALEAKV